MARKLRSHALRSPARLINTLFNDLVTTTVPAECRLCEGPLLRMSSLPVCGDCLARLKGGQPTGCECCGDTYDLDELPDLEDLRFIRSASAYGLLCRPCRLVPPAFVRAVAYGVYTDELRELIHLLKFDGVSSVAPRLGGLLAEAILELEAVTSSNLLVVAVPLFPARERQRGFNQSVLLADAAIKQLKRLRPTWSLTKAHHALKRQRRTESQWALAQRDRRRNLEGAFRVTGDVRGREVLLIDDIMTSGATARECARVLKAAGAAKVWVATVARAHGEQTLSRQQPDELTTAWDLPLNTSNPDALHTQTLN